MMSREMKHSGIEWIGEIPKEWMTCYTSSLFHEHKEKNIGLKNTNLLSLSYGKIKQKDINTNEGLLPQSFETYNVIKKGDIVFRLTDLQNDKRSLRTGLCKEDGIITSAYVTLRANKAVDSTYFHYLFHSYDECKVFYGLGDGVRQGMNWVDVKKLAVFEPPLSEQQKIASYLDKVCGEVDEMITLQEQMIEELKAYKQSVITEAVTKGLNPNVPMKESGIDWIGEVPEHWGTPAISYLAKITSGSTPDRNNPLFWGEGTVNWIKTGELQNNRLSCSEEKVTEYALNNTSIKLYPKDTILMAMYGQGKTRGMTALLDVPCTTNQACAALSIYNKNVNVLFLWKCLIGAYDAIRDKAVGTGQPNLNIDLISKFVIPLPPYNEQVEIVAFIDEIIPQIDSLIALKQAKIEELKEYKKSVIYEYVTGKKEVV